MGGGQVNMPAKICSAAFSWGRHNFRKNFSSHSSFSTNECNGALVRTPPSSDQTLPATDSPRASVLKISPVPYSKIHINRHIFVQRVSTM
jgi:hypothetical protein